MSTYSITLSDLGASRPPGRPSQCRGTGRTPVRQVSGREHLPGRGLPGGCAPRCRADSVSRFAFPHAPRLTCSARPNFENKDGLNLFGRTLRLARIVIRVTAWPRRPGKADRKPATMRLAAHRLVWPGDWEGPSPHHPITGPPVFRAGTVRRGAQGDSADLESREADAGEPRGRVLTGQLASGGTFT